jgi:hypothetical protein
MFAAQQENKSSQAFPAGNLDDEAGCMLYRAVPDRPLKVP